MRIIMKITVIFHANIAIFMGLKQIIVELKNNKISNIKDLIEEIIEKTGKDLHNLIIIERGETTLKTLVTLNGKDINLLNRFETRISEGDIISISPLNLLG
jgi:molybdopterin converting factor small subunit